MEARCPTAIASCVFSAASLLRFLLAVSHLFLSTFTFSDLISIFIIIVSIVPLTFKEENLAFKVIDGITTSIFIFDYILRLITADYKIKKGRLLSFLVYPFTPMAIIDLISILPSFLISMNNGFKLLKLVRMLRSVKMFRLFKFARYSKSITIVINVFKQQRAALLTVSWIALVYILVSALIIMNVEPESFNNYFEAIYWATVSLTTVGYGDIYPVSTIGRIVTMISSVFGIAIVALPAGIITAGMMDEINKNK